MMKLGRRVGVALVMTVACGGATVQDVTDAGGADGQAEATQMDASRHDASLPDVSMSIDATHQTDAGDATTETGVDSSPGIEAGEEAQVGDSSPADARPDAPPPGDSATLCSQACDHVTACTGFTCAQANFDCATAGSSDACLEECVLATPCAQLGVGTLQTCQTMCAADSGAAKDAGGDAAMTHACTACLAQDCLSQVAPCEQDTTCMGWAQCAGMCSAANSPVSCYTACDAQFASASALFDPVYTCACSSCPTACANADPCSR